MWYEPDTNNQMQRFERCVRRCKQTVDNHGIRNINDFRGLMSMPNLMRSGQYGPQWSCHAYNRSLWQNGHSEAHIYNVLMRKYLNVLGHAVTGNTEHDLHVARDTCIKNRAAYKIQYFQRMRAQRRILNHIDGGLPVKMTVLSKHDGKLSLPSPNIEYSIWKYKNLGKGVYRMHFKYIAPWKTDIIYCNKWYVEYVEHVPEFYVYDSEYSAARVYTLKITTVDRQVPLLVLPISFLEQEKRLAACETIQRMWRRRYWKTLNQSAYLIQTLWRVYCMKRMRPFYLVPLACTDSKPYIGKSNLKLTQPWCQKPSFRMVYFYVNRRIMSRDCYTKGGPNGPTIMDWTFDIINGDIHWFYNYGFELKQSIWEYGRDFSIRITKNIDKFTGIREV